MCYYYYYYFFFVPFVFEATAYTITQMNDTDKKLNKKIKPFSWRVGEQVRRAHLSFWRLLSNRSTKTSVNLTYDVCIYIYTIYTCKRWNILCIILVGTHQQFQKVVLGKDARCIDMKWVIDSMYIEARICIFVIINHDINNM